MIARKETAGQKNMKRWIWMNKSIVRKSWISESMSPIYNCEKINECPDMPHSVENVLKEAAAGVARY